MRNPIGLAAGYDKDAEVVDKMLNLGFGFVEVGSITPLPQSGNAKPRVFRLVEDEAVINRYGFNSCGHEQGLKNFNKCTKNINKDNVLIGINLGKNKLSPANKNYDYTSGISYFSAASDYLVINISSPNTPGLRDLQQFDALKTLIKSVQTQREQLAASDRKPILFKIAPDNSKGDLDNIADICVAYNIDGVILTNTTIERPLTLKTKGKFYFNNYNLLNDHF